MIVARYEVPGNWEQKSGLQPQARDQRTSLALRIVSSVPVATGTDAFFWIASAHRWRNFFPGETVLAF